MPLEFPSERLSAQVLISPLKPAVIVGSCAAVSGLAFGGFRAVATGRKPLVSALTVGGTWFGLASIYWYTRAGMVQAFTGETSSSRHSLLFSTAAAAISGGVNAGLQRGANYIWRTSVFFAGVGFISQATWNGIDGLNFKSGIEPGPSIRQRIMQSPWMPLRTISDDEYEATLNQKLVKVKADLDAIDVRIEALRSEASKSTLPSASDDQSQTV